ncbi:MAG TPA: hypothetical protein VF259_01590, partial [Solirubrobacterales bacterium]
TGTRADIGDDSQWGKTGTTDDNGDAWFCGATDEVTSCVWVGYADTLTPMTTEFSGGPVDGGTFPALIWASVISAWQDIQAERAAERGDEKDGGSDAPDSYSPPSYSESESSAPEVETTPSAPEAEAVEPTPEATPEPAPEGGVTGGTGGAAAPG